MTTDLMTLGQRALAAQAFSVWLGTELTRFTAGAAELSLPIRPEFLQQHGFVHGGVLAYLAAHALTFAGGSVLGPAVLTAEFKINYLRPAAGERLIARAGVLSHGQSQAVCRCEIMAVQADGAERVCAAAQGTIVQTASRRD